MSQPTRGPKEQPIRSDQWQLKRRLRTVRADADARRQRAGEYGEGPAQEATGVGPRRADAEPQVLDDRPGNPDNYGNVAPGLYGAHGYSGQPGDPSHFAASPPAKRVSEPLADERLRELIRERLTEDPEIDADDVTLEVQAGTVTLLGSVPSERSRDVIEQCVENCGARAVHNQLRIR